MSIHSEIEVAPAEGPDWAAFAAVQSGEQFFSNWLAILCAQIGGVTGGLLLIASDQAHTFVPAAIWPNHGRDLSYLGPVAQEALTARRGKVVPHPKRASGACVAYPIEVDSELKGAVVLDLVSRPEIELQHALRLVHWGQAWLVDLFRQRLLHERAQQLARVTLANSVVASALQESTFRACGMVVVNELARAFACDRVSLGLERDGIVKVEVMSHTASFDAKSNLSGLIADAMDEVLDAREPLCHPAQGDALLISAGHAVLAEESGAVGVLSVPLESEGRPIGVLTLERNRGLPFDAAETNTSRVIGVLLGPVLALKRDNERSALKRGRDELQQGVGALFGPRHGGVKLIAMLSCVVLVFLMLAKGDHRVSAKTLVEGAVQRASAAPFEGFIAQAFVQAGDQVRTGQVMARLDDKDLLVEQGRWSAEREQYLRKLRQAQANHELAASNVLSAQLDQAEAQLQLINQKLLKTQLLAPFDGVVVSGDLRQLIGTPVEQGKVLFETAPLDAFRVVLQVDEREIAHMAQGQQGELVLSGLPGERFRFTVRQITPVAVAQEGRNFFRVEANMAGGLNRLRPGMEGVGKVTVGRQRLIWIWTHSLLDWLKISLWTWMP